jgi:UPF0755 protein
MPWRVSADRAPRRRARAAAAGVVLAAVLCACARTDRPAARVTIPAGATMRAAAESLAQAGVVGSARLFRLYARLRKSDRGIKAGTYLLDPDASWGSVLGSLRDGKGLVTTVLVPEGFTLSQIETLLETKLGVERDSIRAAASDTALLRRLSTPTATAEGYLFPDTYHFPPATSARAAVAAMVRRFEQRWRPAWTARLDTLGATRHEILTLASIVEREARRPDERPVIASVYWNRLRRGMLLQADPTVQYALPQYQARLMNRHLSVKSPYNTYVNKGLPPGPIGSPGVASIEATLYPAHTPFLYFVAYPDGHHEFRVRLEEHQAEARKARRAWNALRAQEAAAARAAAARPGTPASAAPPAGTPPGNRPGA